MADTEPAEGVPEPFPGYSDASVSDVVARIDSTPEGEERETLKSLIHAVESAQASPRKGVLVASAPTVPQDEDDDEEPDDGRPSLASVASGRAANRNVRVVDVQDKE